MEVDMKYGGAFNYHGQILASKEKPITTEKAKSEAQAKQFMLKGLSERFNIPLALLRFEFDDSKPNYEIWVIQNELPI